MTELVESWSEANEQGAGGFNGTTDGTLASFVDRVRDESERLVSIARTCQETAHELAEREARVHALEQALGDRQRELDARHDELERLQQQLNELAAATERANTRIEEAARREADLRALAHDLLERYGEVPSDG